MQTIVLDYRAKVQPDLLVPVEQHHYRPSTMHMGDCDICGHIQDSPLHMR